MRTSNYKIEVAIYLRGEFLDPVEISKLLGVNPTTSRVKGQSLHSTGGQQGTAKIGVWGLAVKVDTSTLEIASLVDDLFGKLGDPKVSLTTLPQVAEAYLDVFIGANAKPTGGGTCEFRLSAENLANLQRLGLPIHLTVAVVPL